MAKYDKAAAINRLRMGEAAWLEATKLQLCRMQKPDGESLLDPKLVREECRHFANDVTFPDESWNFNDPDWQEASYEEGDSSCNCQGRGWVPVQGDWPYVQAAWPHLSLYAQQDILEAIRLALMKLQVPGPAAFEVVAKALLPGKG